MQNLFWKKLLITGSPEMAKGDGPLGKPFPHLSLKQMDQEMTDRHV